MNSKSALRCLVVTAGLALIVASPCATREQTRTSAGFVLMGGGADQDAAFRWMCGRARTGEFVILRASGTDAYNPYVHGLCPGIESVETLVIASREEAQNPDVVRNIRAAGALFIAGGSQDNYINWWRGTPVNDAINAVISTGAPVGGTSAGLAIMGEYVFAALHDTIQSGDALRDPFDPRVTVDRNLLHIPYLEGKITDSHFAERNRMGRLIVFLARISQNGWTSAPCGIGIDEKTAVLMDGNGTASVVGHGAAYFLHAPGRPEECRAHTPLTYRGISVYRLSAGSGRFDLSSWHGSGGTAYTIFAKDGALASTLPSGAIY